ncbi:MAG: hypothetical protein HY720_11155 [Planctomycetes bacterium]|nr:hypothetical protein [Planctomycetota bacterium]
MIRPSHSRAIAFLLAALVASALAAPAQAQAQAQDSSPELDGKESGEDRSIGLDVEKLGEGGAGALVMSIFVFLYGVLLIGTGDVMRAVVESAKNTRRQADGPSYWAAVTAGVILTIVGSLVLVAGFLAVIIPFVAGLGRG